MINGTFDIASVLTFVLTVIPALYKLVHPLIKAKIDTEKDIQTKHTLELADNIADAGVAEMAVMQSLSPSDRKKEAINFVINHMDDLGKTISQSAASAKVEAAYQNYKNNIGGDIHQPIKPTQVAADPDPIETVKDGEQL